MRYQNTLLEEQNALLEHLSKLQEKSLKTTIMMIQSQDKRANEGFFRQIGLLLIGSFFAGIFAVATNSDAAFAFEGLLILTAILALAGLFFLFRGSS